MRNIVVSSKNIPAFPMIGGTVQVALSELDELRANYRKATELISEYEAHQDQVIVKYYQKTGRSEYDRDRHHIFRGDDNFVEVGREYKGFNEFKAELRAVELNSLETQIKSLSEVVSNYSAQILELDKKNKELSDSLERTEENSKYHQSQAKDWKQSDEISRREIVDRDKTIELLRRQIADLQKPSLVMTFIHWIKNKF